TKGRKAHGFLVPAPCSVRATTLRARPARDRSIAVVDWSHAAPPGGAHRPRTPSACASQTSAHLTASAPGRRRAPPRRRAPAARRGRELPRSVAHGPTTTPGSDLTPPARASATSGGISARERLLFFVHPILRTRRESRVATTPCFKTVFACGRL